MSRCSCIHQCNGGANIDGTDDSTTRMMLGEILASEEEHADDMKSLLAAIDG